MHLPIDTRLALLASAETLSIRVRPDVGDVYALDQLDSTIGALLRLAMEMGEGLPPQSGEADANARAARLHDLARAGQETALRQALAEEGPQLQARLDRFAELNADVAGSEPQFPPLTEPEILAALADILPGARGGRIAGLRTVLGGNSKHTVIFDLIGADGSVLPLVLRRDFPLSSNGKTVADEVGLISALYATGFPAPEVLGFKPAGQGRTAFILMRRELGRPMGDHHGPRADVEGDAIAMLAEVLARLHAIDVDALDLPGYSDVVIDRDHLLALVANERARDARRWPACEPILELAMTWLETHVADGIDRKVIVHGDYGFHNLMSHEGQPLLLDWEMAHSGSAAQDINRARDCLGGRVSFAQFTDLYVGFGGRRPPARALAYYDVLRLVRSTVNYRAAVALFNSGVNTSIRKLNAVATYYVKNLAEIARVIDASLASERN